MRKNPVLIGIALATLVAGATLITIDSPESSVTPDTTTTTTTTSTTEPPVKAVLIPPVTEQPVADQPVQTPDTQVEVQLLPEYPPEPVIVSEEPVVTEPVTSGVADESYWDRMAQCETGGNWQHFPYGTWTGGLGIYNQTWIGWGGGEFAPTAGQATKEQQIIVANRIANDVGYSAWGCVSVVGYP